MKELISFLKENQKEGYKCTKSIRIGIKNNNDDGGALFGYETIIGNIDGMGIESAISIINCEIETHNVTEEKYSDGHYDIGKLDFGDKNATLMGMLSCKYYNGDDDSRKERIGMLSFSWGWVGFIRDSADESTSSHVVITGATGTLSKIEM
jgi:hypothetical protein